LNALDTIQKNAGVTRDKSSGDLFMPRSDYFRGGFNIGGPFPIPHFGEGGPTVISGKDKFYFFTSYERVQTGSAASAGGIVTPTAAGFATLGTIPGLSANNPGAFNSFVPVAPVNDQGTISVLGRNIPVGSVSFAAPELFQTEPRSNQPRLLAEFRNAASRPFHFYQRRRYRQCCKSADILHPHPEQAATVFLHTRSQLLRKSD
jgi:hypothetical protein